MLSALEASIGGVIVQEERACVCAHMHARAQVCCVYACV